MAQVSERSVGITKHCSQHLGQFHALSLQGFTTVIALKPSLDLGSESGLISLTC